MPSKSKRNSKEETQNSGSFDTVEDQQQYKNMDNKSLERLIQQLEQRLDEETKSRNAAQVEYDAVLSYFNVTEKLTLDSDLQARLMSRKIEDREEEQATEIEVYGNKVKYLQYNHTVKLQDENLSKEKLLQEAELTHKMNLLNMDREIECSREALHERQLLHIKEVDLLQEKYQEEIHALQVHFEAELEDYKKRSLRLCDELHEEFYIKNTVDARVYDEKLNHFIFELERLHQSEIQDIHDHYQNTFEDNARVISTLEMKIQDLNIELLDNSKLIDQLTQENDSLIIDLESVTRRRDIILDETRDFEKLHLTLTRTIERLVSSRKELETQSMLYEELEKKYATLQSSHSILKDAVEAAH